MSTIKEEYEIKIKREKKGIKIEVERKKEKRKIVQRVKIMAQNISECNV